MKSSKRIREILGMSQEDLAIYLGITRSLLSMAELGERPLPGKALIKLAQLEKSLLNNTVLPAQRTPEQIKADMAKLKGHAKKCVMEELSLSNELEQLQTEYQQCLRVMLSTAHLMEQLPPAPAGKKDRLWLELQQRKAQKKIKKCGPIEQAILQIRLHAVQHQIAQTGRIHF